MFSTDRESRRPRVGVVGCGGWGRFIVRDLVTLGCRVSVVARSEASKERARAHGGTEIVPSIDELPDLDGAVVATPTSLHAEHIWALIPRDIPIFVEKPLCTDGQAARALAERAPTRIFVMDKWRYHPGVLLLAGIARAGSLGTLVGLKSARLGWGNPHDDVDEIWHLAPHDLSIALEILGDLPAPVYARAEVQDDVPRGLWGTLGSDPWMLLEVSGQHVFHRRRIEIVCSDGSALLDGAYSEQVFIRRKGRSKEEEPEVVPFGQEMPLLTELRAFVEHIEGGPPPKSSVAEGAAVVDTIARLRGLAGLFA